MLVAWTRRKQERATLLGTRQEVHFQGADRTREEKGHRKRAEPEMLTERLPSCCGLEWERGN